MITIKKEKGKKNKQTRLALKSLRGWEFSYPVSSWGERLCEAWNKSCAATNWLHNCLWGEAIHVWGCCCVTIGKTKMCTSSTVHMPAGLLWFGHRLHLQFTPCWQCKQRLFCGLLFLSHQSNTEIIFPSTLLRSNMTAYTYCRNQQGRSPPWKDSLCHRYRPTDDNYPPDQVKWLCDFTHIRDSEREREERRERCGWEDISSLQIVLSWQDMTATFDLLPHVFHLISLLPLCISSHFLLIIQSSPSLRPFHFWSLYPWPIHPTHSFLLFSSIQLRRYGQS